MALEKVTIRQYRDERDLPRIMELMAANLSEPYSIYTYRYFLLKWSKISFVAMKGDKIVGAIICRMSVHKRGTLRGYIGMLAVATELRKQGIGTKLVEASVNAMREANVDEIVLEAEVTNKGALQIYEQMGFVRDKLLERYYLSGVSAWRLKLWLK